jgi:outer membrane protein OmpA-like peptidoglycan-associated protein
MMRVSCPSHARRTLAALLLAAASATAAAAPATLGVTWDADETSWLTLERLRVLVDGSEVPAALAPGAPQPATVYAGSVAAGARTVEVEVAMRGDSDVFTYVEGYTYLMRGRLSLRAIEGDRIAVTARGVAVPGLTVRWEDRYRLALSARVEHAPGALEAALAATAAAEAEPAPVPAPAPEARIAPAGACVLGPVHFAFDSADLDPAARAALARYASCLAGRGGRVQLTGFWDSRGPLSYNIGLGERRGKAAAAFLAKAGLPASRIEVLRSTASAYVCGERTEACHARNRRLEARLLE